MKLKIADSRIPDRVYDTDIEITKEDIENATQKALNGLPEHLPEFDYRAVIVNLLSSSHLRDGIEEAISKADPRTHVDIGVFTIPKSSEAGEAIKRSIEEYHKAIKKTRKRLFGIF